MDKYLIRGERALKGQIKVHGAKNSVLPILAATVLCDETVIENAPDLSDVDAACNILKSLGCKVVREKDTIYVDTRGISSFSLEDSLAREMRSSIIFLGALTARFKRAEMCYPGGCELGSRPVNLHVEALRMLGADIDEIHGRLVCSVKNGLCGTSITLPFPSVGATENAMLAACMATGETIIYNAAREPEIADLALFLNNCGAKISLKQNTIHIVGVKKLHNGHHKIIPDRIEAVTFLAAAAATGGEIELNACIPTHFQSVISVFREMGCEVKLGESSVQLKAPSKIKAVNTIKTMPYPGFPTDAQAPIMAALTKAYGSSIFVENIFDSRYKHVMELRRLGADIETEGRMAVVKGVDKLYSASLSCGDLRGGAALVIGALSACGESTLYGIEHIDRGYSSFEKSLTALGGSVKRIRGE